MSAIKNFTSEIKEGVRQSKWLPLITAYAILSSVIGPGFHYPLMHIPFMAIGLFYAFKSSWKIELTAVLLLLYLPINVLITRPAPIFNSWMRLILFSMVFVFASPLLNSLSFGMYRKKILMGILFICVLLSLGSFVCYFLGVNYMGNQFDGSAILDYRGSAGGFGGLMIQSISLGMVSGLGMLYLLYRALLRPKKERKWYYVVIAVLALTILIAASRSALLSAAAGMLIILYQSNKKNGKFIQILMGILLVGMLTLPLWEDFTTGLKKKIVSDTELGVYGTRTQKWTARITEFSSNPIFGIGFASVDRHHDEVGIRGVVEPGSSWLCILSMTGIIGFILFVLILIKPFQFLISHPTPYNVLLLGLMVFICMHMISEGYIFAGGSSGSVLAWLIFGCASDSIYLKPHRHFNYLAQKYAGDKYVIVLKPKE